MIVVLQLFIVVNCKADLMQRFMVTLVYKRSLPSLQCNAGSCFVCLTVTWAMILHMVAAGSCFVYLTVTWAVIWTIPLHQTTWCIVFIACDLKCVIMHESYMSRWYLVKNCWRGLFWNNYANTDSHCSCKPYQNSWAWLIIRCVINAPSNCVCAHMKWLWQFFPSRQKEKNYGQEWLWQCQSIFNFQDLIEDI